MDLVILQVVPALIAGGVERGTLEIAEAIIEAGGRAIVASSGGPMVGKLVGLGAKHVKMPLDTKSPWRIWRNSRRLARLVYDEGVDILHARSRGPAWSALLAARETGAHFVTTYHGTYNEGYFGKRLYNSVMARGERVIAISEFIAEHIQERHDIDEERLRLIPRGVDERIFSPALVSPQRIEALRSAWRLPGDRPIIMMPARLTRWKGQTVLLDAMKRLPGNAMAVFIGRGSRHFHDELDARIISDNLDERARVVGHVEDMAAALMLADVVVHASTDPEAFGRTVIEAQAMERPVIASDLGGPRETVEHGVTGWLVEPDDPDELAETLQLVLAMSREERAMIGAAARAMVLQSYTTRAMQDATLAVYQEIA